MSVTHLLGGDLNWMKAQQLLLLVIAQEGVFVDPDIALQKILGNMSETGRLTNHLACLIIGRFLRGDMKQEGLSEYERMKKITQEKLTLANNIGLEQKRRMRR